jgi:hypothetical protein
MTVLKPEVSFGVYQSGCRCQYRRLSGAWSSGGVVWKSLRDWKLSVYA